MGIAILLLIISRLLEGENKLLNIGLDTVLLFIFFAVAEIRDKYFSMLFRKK